METEHQPSPLLLDLKIGDDADYLGDPEVVEAIVRNFLADAINVRAAWLAGEAGAEDPEKWLATRSAEEAEKFLGRSNALVPMPGWNAPDGAIIDGIRRRYDLKPGEPEVIAAYPFSALVKAYLEAEAEEAAGREWEHLIEGAIELTVAVLMGTDEVLFPFEPGS